MFSVEQSIYIKASVGALSCNTEPAFCIFYTDDCSVARSVMYENAVPLSMRLWNRMQMLILL